MSEDDGWSVVVGMSVELAKGVVVVRMSVVGREEDCSVAARRSE